MISPTPMWINAHAGGETLLWYGYDEFPQITDFRTAKPIKASVMDDYDDNDPIDAMGLELNSIRHWSASAAIEYTHHLSIDGQADMELVYRNEKSSNGFPVYRRKDDDRTLVLFFAINSQPRSYAMNWYAYKSASFDADYGVAQYYFKMHDGHYANYYAKAHRSSASSRYTLDITLTRLKPKGTVKRQTWSYTRDTRYACETTVENEVDEIQRTYDAQGDINKWYNSTYDGRSFHISTDDVDTTEDEELLQQIVDRMWTSTITEGLHGEWDEALSSACQSLKTLNFNSRLFVTDYLGTAKQLIDSAGFITAPSKTLKDWNSQFLGWHYGYRLTLRDLQDLSHTLVSQALYNRACKRTTIHGSQHNNWHSAYFGKDIDILDNLSIYVTPAPNDVIAKTIYSFDFNASPTNLWDAMPWSFVIDWFTGIGDAIERKSNEIDLNEYWTIHGVSYSSKALIPSECFDIPRYWRNFRATIYYRKASKDLPLSTWVLRPNVTTKRTGLLASLAYTVFG